MDLPVIIYGLTFRDNSLFRKEFIESETQFREFGLDVKWARDLKVKRPKEKSIKSDEDKDALLLSLLLVIITGSGSSLAVFLLELAWYYIAERLIRKVLKERGNNKQSKVTKIQVQSRI